MAGHSAWKNIKRRKAAVDAKRGKIWSKVSRAIIVAAQRGGGDIKFNATLRLAVDEAKAANMPRDTIEKAIKKGTGEGSTERYENVRYEAFGPGGAAIIIDLLIANSNRTAAEIRTIIDKNGGKMGVPGSVAFGFTQQGVILVAAQGTTEDAVMEVALGCDAEDVSADGDYIQVTCKPADFEKVKGALEAASFTIENAEITWTPQSTVSPDADAGARLLALIDAIEDHDDVQKTYHNAELPEE
ncbi:MAG: YebC/PmpR family DNA-binding transcriptional regulator [Phycisphaerae bacterium]|jgi:YebC/PmpR family DNA-binding regulatory protein|nr:YebC/PmpR family DNA-binding transcriptional regulator [Phycisphaerae bacterium]